MRFDTLSEKKRRLSFVLRDLKNRKMINQEVIAVYKENGVLVIVNANTEETKEITSKMYM